MDHNFEESVLEDIKGMEHRLTEMEEKIDDINTKLTQVVDAILGNPLTKTGGFVSELEKAHAKIDEFNKEIDKLSKELEEQKDFKKKVYWTIALLFGVLLLIQYIMNIYSNLNK